MLPTVAQQLQSLRQRMAETIIPALQADARFAREQASFIVLTLDWLIDTHEQQYRYEVLENLEYRSLLADMLERTKGEPAIAALAGAVREALREPGPSSRDAAVPAAQLIGQTRRFKAQVASFYTMLSERGGSRANPARALVAEAARRQADRELSFFRKTGYVGTQPDLESVLSRQMRRHEAEQPGGTR